jgi:hypothetical protein
MRPDDPLDWCEQCESATHVENLKACDAKGFDGHPCCDTKLCSECRAEGEGACRKHGPEASPDSVPGDWWAGGFAANH